MVKFTKQFEGELVPEWKDAFVDYWQLKKHIKKIHIHSTSPPLNPKQKRFFSSSIFISLFGNQCRDHQLIHVHSKLGASTGGSSKQGGVVYQTELLEPQLDAAASEFFGLLDDQLNKVNEFYIKKEKEFVDRHKCLEKQLHILLHLKTALKNSSKDDQQDTTTTISATISCDEESSSRGNIKDLQEEGENAVAEAADDHLDNVNESSPARSSSSSSSSSEEEEQEEEEEEEEEEEDDEEGGAVGRRLEEEEEENGKSSSSNYNYWHGGKSLKIQIPVTNPTRTFSYLLWEDLINQSSQKYNVNAPRGGGGGGGLKKQLLHVNKTKLHHAEKMIRQALIELYKGFGYLKTYRNLNMLAFAKILKKFDKVTNKQVLPLYLKVVESSYFNTSNKIMKLADQVEDIFVKQFAQDDRRKAMKYLKPTHHNSKDSHSLTFFIGLFTGCFIALFVGYAFMAHSTGTYKQQTHTIYMETVYPLLSMFSLLFLHFFLYGCNILMWRQTRINYRFIFELSPTRELKNKDVFLICTLSMTVVVGVLFIHLFLVNRGYSYSQVELIPALLLLVFLVLLVCPINIVYKSSRYRLLSVLRNIVLSPLYKVVMLDFFMADQLCSQVPMLRNLEYIACYYITGSYKTQDYGYCVRTKNYRDLAYAVSFLPYYWRAMQCARRWLDEGETGHLINLGKYVSAMLAAGAKVAYEKERSVGWLCLVVIMSSIATVYQLYWDFVKDWGLLQINSKNPWLRNDLILRRKFIYFFSMGLNLVLRLAWLQTVLHYKFGSIDYRLTGLFLAALEVIRRGQWNFYRLENEHLNNAGKFRAVKTVPLPFHEVDEHD